MMSIFKAKQFIVEEEKVTRYLLNTDHPDGGSKARLFTHHGFDSSEWKVFARALCKQAVSHPVNMVQETPCGNKYVIDGVIETPVNKEILVRTIWMIKMEKENPELVTA